MVAQRLMIETSRASAWLSAFTLVSVVCLGAVWIVYPAVISTVAWLRRPRASREADSFRPTVSVILATREEAATVRARVADLLSSDYSSDQLEIVVARDASAAALRLGEITDEPERVSLVVGEAPGKAAALNAGVQAATGEILVFADSHQRFRSDAIGHLISALADKRYGAVSGRLELSGEQMASRTLVTRYWSLERRLRRDEARVHSAIGVTGAIYAMCRRLWTPLPDGLILDDVLVPMRLVLDGWRVGYVDSARAIDQRTATPGMEFERKVRTLTGVLQLCAWFPAVIVPFRNPVWLQFVFHKLLRLLTPYCTAVILLTSIVSLGGWTFANPKLTIGILALITLWLAGAGRRYLWAARDALVWSIALHAAIVVATTNGLRGRWDVWAHESR